MMTAVSCNDEALRRDMIKKDMPFRGDLDGKVLAPGFDCKSIGNRSPITLIECINSSNRKIIEEE